MANNIIERVWSQSSLTSVEDLQGSAFTSENGAHTFRISGVDSRGDALALSGIVVASFLRSDKTTVAITGVLNDGVASVTLTAECYGTPGRFGLVVFLLNNDEKTAIYSCVGNVARSSTDAVAPAVTADVVDLINQIEAARATIPASYTALMADIAPTYSPYAVYAEGAYVYYNGDLYRCTTAITTAESWSYAHWTMAVLGSDLGNLKREFVAVREYVGPNKNLINPDKESSGWSDYIPVEVGTRYVITHQDVGSGTFDFLINVYDENKELLGMMGIRMTDGELQKFHTFSSGQAYARLAMSSAPSGVDTEDLSRMYFGKYSDGQVFVHYHCTVDDRIEDAKEEVINSIGAATLISGDKYRIAL